MGTGTGRALLLQGIQREGRDADAQHRSRNFERLPAAFAGFVPAAMRGVGTSDGDRGDDAQNDKAIAVKQASTQYHEECKDEFHVASIL